jgi:hypothetical protein
LSLGRVNAEGDIPFATIPKKSIVRKPTSAETHHPMGYQTACLPRVQAIYDHYQLKVYETEKIGD